MTLDKNKLKELAGSDNVYGMAILALLAELEAAEKEVINQQRECHTIRRAYLHEKCVKEAAEERVRELTQQIENRQLFCDDCDEELQQEACDRVRPCKCTWVSTEKLNRLSVMETALRKVNDVRNDMVGRQFASISLHAYPLVAALDEAGFKGMSYEEARDAVIAKDKSDQGGNNGA